MKRNAGVLLTVLVLVGAPLAVFAVARAEGSHRRVSRLAAEAARLTADLQRKGATDVRCGWTGYADGSAYTVTCSGVLGSSSFDSLRESEVATVTSDR